LELSSLDSLLNFLDLSSSIRAMISLSFFKSVIEKHYSIEGGGGLLRII